MLIEVHRPFRGWKFGVDGKKKWQVFNSSTLDVTLSIDKGSRRVTVQAVDSAGTFKSTAYVTVN